MNFEALGSVEQSPIAYISVATPPLANTPPPPEAFTENTLLDSSVHEVTKHDKLRDVTKRFLSFAVMRQTASLEWAGGIVGGELMVDHAGTNRWLAAAGVSALVSGAEYAQTSWAVKRTGTNGSGSVENDTKPGLAKELVAFGSSLWNGAASTVTYNESVGIASTPRRRKVQSALYGLAVGAWVSPVPPFRQLSDGAQELFTDLAHHPIESLSTATITSLTLFGILEVIKQRRLNRPPERAVTKLPEHLAEKITPTKAWLGVGALALLSKVPVSVTESKITKAVTTSIASRLNRKGHLDIPK